MVCRQEEAEDKEDEEEEEEEAEEWVRREKGCCCCFFVFKPRKFVVGSDIWGERAVGIVELMVIRIEYK